LTGNGTESHLLGTAQHAERILFIALDGVSGDEGVVYIDLPIVVAGTRLTESWWVLRGLQIERETLVIFVQRGGFLIFELTAVLRWKGHCCRRLTMLVYGVNARWIETWSS